MCQKSGPRQNNLRPRPAPFGPLRWIRTDERARLKQPGTKLCQKQREGRSGTAVHRAFPKPGSPSLGARPAHPRCLSSSPGVRTKHGQLLVSPCAHTVPTSRPACARRRAAGGRTPRASRVREAPWGLRQRIEYASLPALCEQGRGGTRPSRVDRLAADGTTGTGLARWREGFHTVRRRGFLARRSLGCGLGRRGDPGPQRVPSRPPPKSGRLWEAGLGREPPGRSVAVGKRQPAGALQTLREFEGAVWGRGSAGSAAACRRCGI